MRRAPVPIVLLLALLVVPVAWLGPTIARGELFLPQLPAGLEPLASEDPLRAELAWRDANYLASDRIFPILTDELAVQRAFRAGELPLWNPLQGLGLPLLGGTMVGPLYPPNWIAYATDPARAGGWLAMLSLVLAGLGAVLFLRRRGASVGACVVGALAIQTGGFAFANLHYRMKVDAGLWLPWALWAVDGLASAGLDGIDRARRRTRATLALAGAIALSCLAGFPPIAVFVASTALAYAAMRRWIDRVRELAMSRVVLGLALGVAIGAVQLLPTLEASRASARERSSPRALTVESLPIGASVTIVAPAALGSPTDRPLGDRAPAAWWLSRESEVFAAQHANALEWNLFAGCAVLALAIGALAGMPRGSRSLAALALLAIAFAQGWPGVRELYRLPGFDLGSPARAASAWWPLVALLAGLGAQAVIVRAPRAAIFAGGFAAALATAGLWVFTQLEPETIAAAMERTLAARHALPVEDVRAWLGVDESRESARRWTVEGQRVFVAGLAALGAILLARQVGRARLAAPWIALAAIVAIEGLAAGGLHVRGRASDALFPPSQAIDALRTAAGEGRVLRLDASTSGVDEVLALARPNLPEAYGVADLTPYVAFSDRRLVELLAALDPSSRYRSGASRLSRRELLGSPLLDALGVTAVLARDPIEDPGLELVFAREGFHVHRRRHAAPIVRFVARGLESANERVELEQLLAPDFDPRSSCVLAPGARFDEPADAASAPAPIVRIAKRGAQRLVLDVVDAQAGLIVVSESFADGWTARVDGVEASLLRVDRACRAVAIDAATRRVELAYRPVPLALGASICAVALAICAVLAWRSSHPR